MLRDDTQRNVSAVLLFLLAQEGETAHVAAIRGACGLKSHGSHSGAYCGSAAVTSVYEVLRHHSRAWIDSPSRGFWRLTAAGRAEALRLKESEPQAPVLVVDAAPDGQHSIESLAARVERLEAINARLFASLAVLGVEG